jgi:hypothetical protein
MCIAGHVQLVDHLKVDCASIVRRLRVVTRNVHSNNCA